MNGYDLSRAWFDYCFEHPNKVKPNHTALYFFAIEHCNRLGWKLKFGLPTAMTMEAIGIKSFNTYSNTLNDIVEWGFMVMIEKSKNQYSSNVVSLTKFDKKLLKSLDNGLIKHYSRPIKKSESIVQSIGESTIQSTSESTHQSTVQSIDSIDKQITKNKEQRTINKEPVIPPEDYFLDYCKEFLKESYQPLEFSLKAKFEQWVADGWKDGNGNSIKNWKTKIKNTAPYLKPLNNGKGKPTYNDNKARVNELNTAARTILSDPNNFLPK